MNTKMPKIVAIIPARMESSRFPGKPLASILGIPMVEHVRKRVALCKSLDETYVATCNKEIFETVVGFGGKAIMTSSSHERASDRVAEAAQDIDGDIIVLVQGDEPMTVPSMIDAAIDPMLTDPTIGCVNLTKKISDHKSWMDPNTIKVVFDLDGDALYFSRQAIPTNHILGQNEIPMFKQVCIIPFRKETLLAYPTLKPSPLELSESVDMMRFLEHGYKVRMVETNYDTYSIDTPDDLKRVEALMRNDKLTKTYVSKLIK